MCLDRVLSAEAYRAAWLNDEDLPELIRLEAPDAEPVGLRDALQRLVLEGRVGAGESQTLANQVSAQIGPLVQQIALMLPSS